MNTLKELQLLEHEHYGKIILTESGSDMAKNILDTNKIIYRFLTEILDVDEQTAIAEADLMGSFPFDHPTYLVQSDSPASSVRHSQFDILR